MASTTRLDVGFDWQGLRLAGTLEVPPADTGCPVVLMLQGSGAADRQSGGYFAPIQHAFLDRGIATYSYDKPGCGDSTGDWRDHGIEARVDQAVIALAMLRNHPALAAHDVGVWGHSQGGWVAQQLAGRVDDLAFAIANSGPTIDVAAQNLYEFTQALRTDNRPQAEISEALAFLTDLHEAARSGETYAAVRQNLDASASKPWSSYFTVEDEPDWRHFQILITEPLDPVAALSAVHCPFLAIYGGLDLLVPPWRGAKQSGKALQTAPTADSTVMVFPEGDHRMQDPSTGEFVAGYLDTVSDWATQRVQEP